jgi:hypothetical protein
MKKIFTAIQIECDRQEVGLDRVMMLADVYSDAMHIGMDDLAPREDDFLERDGFAYLIEPKNRGQYRRTPVFFADLSTAMAPSLIPSQMTKWWTRLDWVWETRHQSDPMHFREDVDELIREFLVIHPFQDGNGRIAWLLRVWMLHQWEDPEELPNYFPQNVGKQTV